MQTDNTLELYFQRLAVREKINLLSLTLGIALFNKINLLDYNQRGISLLIQTKTITPLKWNVKKTSSNSLFYL